MHYCVIYFTVARSSGGRSSAEWAVKVINRMKRIFSSWHFFFPFFCATSCVELRTTALSHRVMMIMTFLRNRAVIRLTYREKRRIFELTEARLIDRSTRVRRLSRLTKSCFYVSFFCSAKKWSTNANIISRIAPTPPHSLAGNFPINLRQLYFKLRRGARAELN